MTQTSAISFREYPIPKIEPLAVKKTFSEHLHGVTGLGILDGSRFVSCSYDRSIKTWDKSFPTSLKTQKADPINRIWGMQLFPDKVWVALMWAPVHNDKAIRIYNTQNGKYHDLSGLYGHQKEVTSLAVSKEGLLASGSQDGCVKIWDAFASTLLHTYCTTGESPACVGFLSDGKTVVCGNYQKREIQFWEITTAKPDDRKPDKVFHTPAKINSLLVMKNGNIATGHADGVVRIWDSLETEKKALKKELRGHHGHVPALAERPDHLLVSGSSDRTIMLWDTETGESWTSATEHTNEIHAIAVFDDNSVLTASLDRTVKLWSKTSPRQSKL